MIGTEFMELSTVSVATPPGWREMESAGEEAETKRVWSSFAKRMLASLERPGGPERVRCADSGLRDGAMTYRTERTGRICCWLLEAARRGCC